MNQQKDDDVRYYAIFGLFLLVLLVNMLLNEAEKETDREASNAPLALMAKEAGN
jgi:hypothetical protein